MQEQQLEQPTIYSIKTDPKQATSEVDTHPLTVHERNEAMRWVFLAFLMIWILVAVILTIVAFCLTRNPLCFSLFSTIAPPFYILSRITVYLFPKSKSDYKLQTLRVKYGVRKVWERQDKPSKNVP